jgi:hypothetical protein
MPPGSSLQHFCPCPSSPSDWNPPYHSLEKICRKIKKYV